MYSRVPVRQYRYQKAALTRAINSGEPWNVIRECQKVMQEWNSIHHTIPGCWPDAWHRWSIAYDDAVMQNRRNDGPVPPPNPFQ